MTRHGPALLEASPPPAAVRSAYRLQLRPGFGFEAAVEILDYLAALGISHILISPILTPAEGSTHGYDVADPETVNPELGGEAGFARWTAALAAAGLRQVLDIVPNHMSIATPRNRWWQSVLRLGAASPYAHFFDLDWRAGEKILLPFLRRSLAATLAGNELRLERGDGGERVLGYGNMRFPLAPGTDDGDAATVLARQHYRLAHWSAADHELPYRRFFDVSHLIGLRVERPEVFAASHQRILDWLAEGSLDGVRVDHVDGLREPAAYLERLRAAAPEAWIVVEKILAHGEALPPWPVAGTTGYDFLNLVQGLFLAPEAAAALEAAYQGFAGPQPSWPATVRASKRHVLTHLLHSELRRLSARARALPGLRTYTPVQLDHAIGELVQQYSVYRTYVGAAGPAAPADAAALAATLAAAIAAVRAGAPALEPVLHALASHLPGTEGGRGRGFCLSLQQFTPALVAKGVEDTASYRYHRLTALNEVGGDPERFGTSVEEFHRAMDAARHQWPEAMLATSTHDTKRGEDVRARLCLLSEIPERWRQAALAWQARNRRYASSAGPDANTEYLFYQTLVGAWPIEPERMQAYLLKCVREAKVHTSWRKPQAAYERGLRRFVARVMADREAMSLAAAFVAPLVAAGHVNSLAQTLLKLTAPGVPAIYNGAELWDGNLVDPDNRRPVDFGLRRRLLAELMEGMSPEAIWARQEEGLPKLWVIQRALALRRERPQAFSGGYEPLAASGPHAQHVIAFARARAIATIAPRLGMSVPGWPATATTTCVPLPPGRWRNCLTGDSFAGGPQTAAALLARFPVALLAQAQPVFAGGCAPAASRWSAPPGRSGIGRVGQQAGGIRGRNGASLRTPFLGLDLASGKATRLSPHQEDR